MLEMTSDYNGETESGKPVPAGTRVTYRGHIVGGMVVVELPDGTEEVMHPACFEGLKERSGTGEKRGTGHE